MKKRVKIICAVCLFISLLVVVPGPTSQAQHARIADRAEQVEVSFVPGRVLVKFRPGVPGFSAKDPMAEVGARDAGEIANTDVHLLELPEGADEEAMVRAFE